jgi:hypothetical protein
MVNAFPGASNGFPSSSSFLDDFYFTTVGFPITGNPYCYPKAAVVALVKFDSTTTSPWTNMASTASASYILAIDDIIRISIFLCFKIIKNRLDSA